MRRSPIPAIEIGGTHVAAALVDPASWRTTSDGIRSGPLDSSAEPDQIVAEIVDCASAIEPELGSTWGVAIPGPFDYASGIGRFEGVAKFEALNGFDLGAALLDALGPKADRLEFLNDAQAFLIGEWLSGVVSGQSRVVGITLGTGIGSAFLADGAIVDRGDQVPPQGNVHLLNIGDKPLEEVVSRRAVISRYAQLTEEPHPDVDVVDIAQRAKAGDAPAVRVFADAFTSLGQALRPWLGDFGASALVVGGAIADSWELVAEPLRAGIGPIAEQISMVRAAHPDEAALIGAARHADRG